MKLRLDLLRVMDLYVLITSCFGEQDSGQPDICERPYATAVQFYPDLALTSRNDVTRNEITPCVSYSSAGPYASTDVCHAGTSSDRRANRWHVNFMRMRLPSGTSLSQARALGVGFCDGWGLVRIGDVSLSP